jgi:hypothetical protein
MISYKTILYYCSVNLVISFVYENRKLLFIKLIEKDIGSKKYKEFINSNELYKVEYLDYDIIKCDNISYSCKKERLILNYYKYDNLVYIYNSNNNETEYTLYKLNPLMKKIYNNIDLFYNLNKKTKELVVKYV